MENTVLQTPGCPYLKNQFNFWTEKPLTANDLSTARNLINARVPSCTEDGFEWDGNEENARNWICNVQNNRNPGDPRFDYVPYQIRYTGSYFYAKFGVPLWLVLDTIKAIEHTGHKVTYTQGFRINGTLTKRRVKVR